MTEPLSQPRVITLQYAVQFMQWNIGETDMHHPDQYATPSCLFNTPASTLCISHFYVLSMEEGLWHGLHVLLAPLLPGLPNLGGFTLAYWIALVYIAAPKDFSYGEFVRLMGICRAIQSNCVTRHLVRVRSCRWESK